MLSLVLTTPSTVYTHSVDNVQCPCSILVIVSLVILFAGKDSFCYDLLMLKSSAIKPNYQQKYLGSTKSERL